MLVSYPKQGIQLLVTLLLQFPFLSIATYREEQSVLQFTFIMRGEVSSSLCERFTDLLCQHIQAWRTLVDPVCSMDQSEAIQGRFEFTFDPLTERSIFIYSVPVFRFCIGEMRIVCALLERQFESNLVLFDSLEASVTAYSDEELERAIREEGVFSNSSHFAVYRDGDRIFVS